MSFPEGLPTTTFLAHLPAACRSTAEYFKRPKGNRSEQRMKDNETKQNMNGGEVLTTAQSDACLIIVKQAHGSRREYTLCPRWLPALGLGRKMVRWRDFM